MNLGSGISPKENVTGNPRSDASGRREITTRVIIFRWVILIVSSSLFLTLCAVFGMGYAWFQNYLDALPTIDYLENYRPQIPSRLLDSKGNLIQEVFGSLGENRQQVTLEELPKHLVNAVVATEDKRFYDHFGLDPIRIPKAAWVNFTSGRIRQGASTLTTQLAKDLYVRGVRGEGARERTYEQKINEAFLALQIERHYSKEEILEIYLNQVYLGDRNRNVAGVAAAAQYYFGKPVSQLNLKQCAMIAGILQLPGAWSPFQNIDQAERRTRIALKAMLDAGYITEEEYQRALKTPFDLRDRTAKQKTLVEKYPYFGAYVRRSFQKGELNGPEGQPIFLGGTGVDVETTLDPDLQDAAIEALRNGIEAHERRRRELHGSRWGEPIDSAPNADSPSKILAGYTYDAYIAEPWQEGATYVQVTFPRVEEGDQPRAAIFNATESWLDDFGILEPDMCVRVSVEKSASGGLVYSVTKEEYVQGALVALRPSTGEILALVGGYDFYDEDNAGRFIRATQAYRQPGSAFKPLLYACALHNGYHAASMIEDREQTFHFAGTEWTPENFEGRYFDMVTLHEALAESLNAGTIWLLQHLGRSQTAGILTLHRFCRRTFDLRLRKPDLTIALGSEEVSPLQLAKAYAVFASGGVLVEPYAVSKVHEQERTRNQVPRVLYEHRLQWRRVIDRRHARLMTGLLEGVVDYGTGRDVKQNCQVPLVGKTGTTDNCTNAWFAGYGKDLVCVVFVGFDSNRSLGAHMTGSKVALPIWIEFMNRVAEIRPELFGEFELPPGVVERSICLDHGTVATPGCPRTRRMLFLKENVPTMSCPFHGEFDIRPVVLDDSRQAPSDRQETGQAAPVDATDSGWVPLSSFNRAPVSSTEEIRAPFPSLSPQQLQPVPTATPTPKKSRAWWRF